MHFLFLASFFPNRVRKIVGIFMYNHAQSIAQKYKVTVLSIEKDVNIIEPTEVSYEKKGLLNVYIIYYNPNKIRFFFRKINTYYILFKTIIKTISIIEKDYGEINKVHLNVSHPLGIIAMYLKFFKNKVYLISEQSTLFVLDHFQKHSFFGRLIIKFTYKYASGLSVITDFLGQSIFKLGLYKKPYHIIPNIVSTEYFNLDNKTNRNDIPVFIHVSTLRPAKGVDILLDACVLLSKKGVQYKFIIVGGTGDYFHHVVNKVEKLNLKEQVVLTGELASKEIAEYLKKSDFFVLNSEFETFCVVMVEALACGLPVIAHSNTAIPENLNNQRGMLLQERTPEVWAESIIKMIDSKDLFNQYELYKFVDDSFSPNAISLKFEEFLKS